MIKHIIKRGIFTEKFLVKKFASNAIYSQYIKNGYFQNKKDKDRFIEELNKYCKFSIDSNTKKYNISEVFDTPKIINKLKRYSQLKIKDNEYNDVGVYAIILQNNIYIGSTTIGFRNRFLQHLKWEKLSTKQMLLNDGEFIILYKSLKNEKSEIFIRNKEKELIDEYKNNENWNVINKNNPYLYNKTNEKNIYFKTDSIDEVNMLVKNGFNIIKATKNKKIYFYFDKTEDLIMFLNL